MIDANAESIVRARRALNAAEAAIKESEQGAFNSPSADRLIARGAEYRAQADAWIKIAELISG